MNSSQNLARPPSAEWCISAGFFFFFGGGGGGDEIVSFFQEHNKLLFHLKSEQTLSWDRHSCPPPLHLSKLKSFKPSYGQTEAVSTLIVK